VLWRSIANYPSSVFSAFRAQVDYPICTLDDFKIVLDDDKGVMRVTQLNEHFE
jgi:hypothetical protein